LEGFYSASSLNQPFGTPGEMKRPEGEYHVSQMTSAIEHFYAKLLLLKDSMNTVYAKSLAQDRHDFMIEFLKRFELEWSGKK
jgi:uncharacterized protein